MHPTVYLDANATTQILPAALAAATRMMQTQFGNASSSHSHGLAARAVLDQARTTAAQVLGAGKGRVLFTSGATESIQTAVLSALCAVRERRARGAATGNLLVYGATEHKAVPQALAHWNDVLGLALELRALPVNPAGLPDLHTLALWLPDTALLCTMAANNETGVVTDLASIERLLEAAHNPARSPALWLVDGVQALGKLPLNLLRTRIDYAAFSGHKLHTPKGVGMLYVRPGAPFTALMAGGGQEGGQRSGTENMPGIAALGAVLQALLDGDTFASHAALHGYRAQLAASLRSAFPAIEFNMPLTGSLPTTLNFSVPGLPSKALMDVFDAAGLRVSAGSACSAAQSAPSHVLLAMGLDAQRAASAVRLSIGLLADARLIDAACEAIARCGRAQEKVPAAPLPEATQASAPVPAQTAATAGAGDIATPDAAAFTLQWSELDAFLQTHPQARLVDLRERAEQQAGGGIAHGGRTALSAPASELGPQIPAWCAPGATPVVLLCRSGNRSLKVARWLHGQGHTAVRHLHGGLALRPGLV